MAVAPIKMEDLTQVGKFEDSNIINSNNNDNNNKALVEHEAGAHAMVSQKIKQADHPVGEVEIQPPKVAEVHDSNNAEKEELVVEDAEGDRIGYNTDQLQFMMGLSLVVGFVFMLLVDQCGGKGGHSHSLLSGKVFRPSGRAFGNDPQVLMLAGACIVVRAQWCTHSGAHTVVHWCIHSGSSNGEFPS